MKRKVISKSKRSLARLVADFDGKYKGITQAEVEKTFTFIVALEAAARLAGYKSPLVMLKSKAIKKAAAVKKSKVRR